MQDEDSPSRIPNPKWDDLLPELRSNLALARRSYWTVSDQTVDWYEDEVDEYGYFAEEGLVRVSSISDVPAQKALNTPPDIIIEKCPLVSRRTFLNYYVEGCTQFAKRRISTD